MKYYIDTEFIEDFRKPFLGKKRHFIDLISIAIICEDGREYYAISKDFDLKQVWNKCEPGMPDEKTGIPAPEFWLRDNVLKPIYEELYVKVNIHAKTHHPHLIQPFSYAALKTLISWYGKTEKQIAEEIKAFAYADSLNKNGGQIILGKAFPNKYENIEFYAYYGDYDWVLFCSLFGRMIDLPNGFPMYCRDLKQSVDELNACFTIDYSIQEDSDYPVQENEHSAISDVRWIKKLDEFIISYKKRGTRLT